MIKIYCIISYSQCGWGTHVPINLTTSYLQIMHTWHDICKFCLFVWFLVLVLCVWFFVGFFLGGGMAERGLCKSLSITKELLLKVINYFCLYLIALSIWLFHTNDHNIKHLFLPFTIRVLRVPKAKNPKLKRSISLRFYDLCLFVWKVIIDKYWLLVFLLLFLFQVGWG